MASLLEIVANELMLIYGIGRGEAFWKAMLREEAMDRDMLSPMANGNRLEMERLQRESNVSAHALKMQAGPFNKIHWDE